ncbi:MAG TPA: hypothetical protein EYP67_06555 [Methanosarcinales archaeon]|nr:hypothetical protein [Methanosarcinales archaeon]
MKKRTILLIVLVAMVMLCAASAAETVEQVEIRGTVVEADAAGQLREAGSAAYESNYTWNPYNFGAFWYDVDDDLGSEWLIIEGVDAVDNRSIPDEKLVYSTTPQAQTYALVDDCVASRLGVVSGNWVAQYFVEGWMGEKYVAISTGGSTSAHGNKLSKLLVEFTDSSDKKTLLIGETWDLGNGFTLTAASIDIEGDKVWLTLAKDGRNLDDAVIDTSASGNRVYMYTADVSGVSDVVIFSCYVDAVFVGKDIDLVQLKYVYLINNDILLVRTGDEYGNMEVTSAGSVGITLKNNAAIDLAKCADVEIAEDMYFRVADSDTVRFYPYKGYREPGEYDVRGMIVGVNAISSAIYPAGGNPAAGTAGYTWNPYNFGAFFYDVDDDLKSEQLIIENLDATDNRYILDDKLIYNTTPAVQTYPIVDDGVASSLGTVSGSPVTQYFIEGFLAEEYVAISTGGSTSANGHKLSKLLVEFTGSDNKTLAIGEAWGMGGGFTLTPRQIDPDNGRVWLTLAKDGRNLDDYVVDTGAGGDRRYMYTEDLSGVEDVIVFFCYVDAVFSDNGTDLVRLKYVYLIDNDVLKVRTDETYGNMDVKTASASGITMKNDAAIDLCKNADVMITEDIYFKVADNDTVRFYPYVKRTIGGEEPIPPGSIPDTDIDGDGVPDVWDADNSTLPGYWVNQQGIGRMWGDMNGDGRLTSVDALMILKAAAGGT